jgi:CRISPR-associated protein Csb1
MSITRLDLQTLHATVSGSAAAFRCRRRLQPAGGPGDKVFPPTFAGAVYAVEQRRVFGDDGKPLPEPKTCVVLDTVQSQANRMELALQEALDAGWIKIPVIKVDFSDWSPNGQKPEAERFIDDVGVITSLQVPHRLADAILRDSQTTAGVAFRQSDHGRALNTVSQRNATALYQLCPTALIFGMWDSSGPKGGLGEKFERAIVSEVFGVNATFGVKTSSRIDPLITKTEGIDIYRAPQARWTPDRAAALKELSSALAKKLNAPVGAVFAHWSLSDQPLGSRSVSFYDSDGGMLMEVTVEDAALLKELDAADPAKLKKGKVSEINLGNVTPDHDRYDPKAITVKNRLTPDPLRTDGGFIEPKRIRPGGVTIEYAEQITTLSLIALRRLQFPLDEGRVTPAANVAARTVLAALGLCAATLAFENGIGLRSRCLLWPVKPMTWELLVKPGETPIEYTLTSTDAMKLLEDAVAAAKSEKVGWHAEGLGLMPSAELAKLVRLSQAKALSSGAEAEED